MVVKLDCMEAFNSYDSVELLKSQKSIRECYKF